MYDSDTVYAFNYLTSRECADMATPVFMYCASVFLCGDVMFAALVEC